MRRLLPGGRWGSGGGGGEDRAQRPCSSLDPAR